MQKLLSTLFLSTITLAGLSAQTTAGYQLFGSYIDMNGQVIHDHADQDYFPEKAVNISFDKLKTYAPGKIYKLNEQTISGRLFCTSSSYPTKLFFKEQKGSIRENVNLKDLKGVKIGTDSFIVANGFSIHGKLGLVVTSEENHHLLQHIATTDNFVFFKYQPATGQPNLLICKRDTEKLISLPLIHKQFMVKAHELFKNYPHLIELLEEKKIAPDEWTNLLKFIQYADAQQANKPIWYTSTFEITDNPLEHTYYSLVSLQGKNWTLDFYNKIGEKIFTELYLYEQPSKNNGETVWYYNGTNVVRKKVVSSIDEASTTIDIFYRNGKLHYKIIIDKFGEKKYKQVLSEDGIQRLDHQGNGTEQFYDEVGKRTITRGYKNSILSISYYVDEKSRIIYQSTNKNTLVLSLSNSNNVLAEYVKYPDQSIEAGEEGVVLVKFIMTPNGQVEEHSILRGVSQNIDDMVTEIINLKILKIKCMNEKIGKDNIFQEVVVPFRFSIRKELINDNRYYYHHPVFIEQIHHTPMGPIRIQTMRF